MLVTTCGGRMQLAVATALTISQAGSALAHGFAGSRFFPATITIDDPFVADEMSLPTVSNAKIGTDPSVVETAISGELSKRITSEFGLSIGYAWNHLDQAGPPHNPNGFQNLEITPRYQFLLNAPHEAVASVGVITELGGTGARQVGAVPFATYTPTLYFGKGAGDLPETLNWARPFAVTGILGYSITSSKKIRSQVVDPDTGFTTLDVAHVSNALNYGIAIEYSNFYLRANVHDFGLPEWVNRLTPLVEFRFATPVTDRYGEKTVGTINPGIIWSGQSMQFGVEAIIPVTKATGKNVGIIAQLHFYLDDIFPQTIGRPLLDIK
jgi:hypothetical protein